MTAVPGDVGDPAHRAALVRAAGRTGGADLLVNNAGTLGASPLPALADYPLDELRAAFESNVVAPVALIQALLPSLRQRGGAILNITSDAATGAYTGWGGYGAAKAALEQASNVLAAEENTVRVWWVDPGDLRTRMHQQAFPGEDISDRPLPEPGRPRLPAADHRPPAERALPRCRTAARRACARLGDHDDHRLHPAGRAGGARSAGGAGHAPGRRPDAGQPGHDRAAQPPPLR